MGQKQAYFVAVISVPQKKAFLLLSAFREYVNILMPWESKTRSNFSTVLMQASITKMSISLFLPYLPNSPKIISPLATLQLTISATH